MIKNNGLPRYADQVLARQLGTAFLACIKHTRMLDTPKDYFVLQPGVRLQDMYSIPVFSKLGNRSQFVWPQRQKLKLVIFVVLVMTDTAGTEPWHFVKIDAVFAK